MSTALDDLFIPMPPIKRLCKRCGVTGADVADAAGIVISPSKTAHYGDYDGMTDCGGDATKDGWWWPC